MTLGEKWAAKLNERTKEEILFEAIDKRIEKAMEDHEEYIWFNYGSDLAGVHITHELLQKYAETRDLKLKKVASNGWYLTPTSIEVKSPYEESGLP